MFVLHNDYTDRKFDVERQWSSEYTKAVAALNRSSYGPKERASSTVFSGVGLVLLVLETESQRESCNNLKQTGNPRLLDSGTFHERRHVKFVTQIPALFLRHVIWIVLTS